MNLEQIIFEYKDITLTIMELIKLEEYEKVDKFFKQRQLILDNINKSSYSKEELKEFFIKFHIDELDKVLESEMKNKKEELLIKIKQNQKRRTAMNGYNNLQAKAVFLSREF
ncbi:hypothetical protein C1H57_00445 [Clostridium sp. 2-1]|nr:hypothetical protein C1H57_00445 [Clostridium sp. 2-1]